MIDERVQLGDAMPGEVPLSYILKASCVSRGEQASKQCSSWHFRLCPDFSSLHKQTNKTLFVPSTVFVTVFFTAIGN